VKVVSGAMLSHLPHGGADVRRYRSALYDEKGLVKRFEGRDSVWQVKFVKNLFGIAA
jgi:hypothetical protein